MIDLELCDCGRHGRFVDASTRDAVAGPEIATKSDALVFVDGAYLRDVIGPMNASRLAAQINGSGLAENEASADPAVLTAVRDWNCRVVTANDLVAFLSSRPDRCLIASLAS